MQISAPLSLEILHSTVLLPSQKWTDQTTNSLVEIKLCMLGEHSIPSGKEGVVILTLTIKPDFSWSLLVHGVEVTQLRCPAISKLPSHISSPEDINGILTLLDSLVLCSGHPDSHLVEMATSRKHFEARTAAFVDSQSDYNIGSETYSTTVRTKSCSMLVSTQSRKCSACVRYRSTLRTMYNRCCSQNSQNRNEQASTSTSHTNIRYLTSPEKSLRINSLKARAISAEHKLEHLKERIKKCTEIKGVKVDDDLNNDLKLIVEKQTPKIVEEFPQGSFRRLFWEQQCEALKKSPRQMRWHPTMIKWCLNLKLTSTAAYETMRSSGFLSLPSTRTLRDYTHFIQSKTGIQPEVTQHLMHEARISTIKDFEKHVAVAFDEIRIKDSLVYDKHNSRIIGFVDVGAVNNDLLSFEQSVNNSSENEILSSTVAKYMLVIMVRGIFIPLKYPYAQFSTRGITADLLFPLMWEAIQKLELAGFKVIAITCDGASSNRKFFCMHGDSSDGIVYKTANPYTDEDRCVYFFADVPHLMKTVRNCWSNSFSHSYSRALWVF